jgi:IclR family transcriptional regulator, KDG regulon repressor
MSQTLDRALRILGYVGEKPRRIGEIAEFLDVHHSTALRFLHTLRKHGFVHEMPDHRYRLGSAMFRLGFQALDGIELRSVARPFMEKLGAAVGETVHLGALEDGGVVYIDKVEADHRVRLVSRIGAVGAIHATGVGKGILAFLPEDKRHALLELRELKKFTNNTLTTVEALEADLARSRERGYALDDEENEPGIHCVSAPILSGDGEVVGSMSVSTPISRVDDDTLLSFVPALLEATEGTSRQLGWTR